MGWPLILGLATVPLLVLGYEALANAEPEPAPGPKPGPRPVWKPPAPVKPAPSHGTAQPHTVPGGHFTYTGAQASPETVQAAANALAAVDPTLKQNEQLVRNFQDAAGLAQRPGATGWDQVHPTGTDGRYGHDVRAVLGQYVANPPPVSATRPTWWGPHGTYDNP